jgi:hypothetical protein
MKNGNVEYTSVDELIVELQKISKDGHGDYPVCVNGVSPVFVDSRPSHYDGGYLVRDASKGNYNFLRSCPRDEDGNRTGIHPDVKDMCFDVMSCDPTGEDTATIDGRTVRDIEPETWSFLDAIEQKEMVDFGGLVKYKIASKVDKEMGYFPFTAYLESGESAIGSNMKNAREALKLVVKKT